MLAGLLCTSLAYGIDTQTIRLAAPKGSQLTLTFGGTGKVTVDWGDGAQAYTPGTVNGTTQTDTVVVTITQRVTSFDCSGQGITWLDANGATDLLVLNCAQNKLTELKVNKMAGLQELNCSDNQLTELGLASNTALRYLDCSDNQLTELTLTRNTELQVLGCSRNRLPTLAINLNKDLRGLWADDNYLIGTLGMPMHEKMTSVILSNNGMERLNILPTEALTDLWVDHNELTTLNLGTTTGMKTINLSDNQLKSLVINSVAGMDMYMADFSHNKLGFQYFLPSDKVANYVCGLQAPVDFGIDTVQVNDMVDFSEFLKNAGGSKVGTITLYNAATGEPLVKGTDPTATDYQILSGRARFWHGIDSVYGIVTSTRYPTLEIRSNAFTVYDPDATGIHSATTADGLSVTAGEGYLTLRSSRPAEVRITATDGRTVWTGTTTGTTVSLPKGIYLVNNRKVQVK